MTKAATAIKESPTIANEPVLYDARVPQRIPFVLERDGHDYPLAHVLNPVTNERYFEFENALELMTQKLKRVSSALYVPKHALWLDLVESREGYKERPDWRERTHQSDAVGVVNAMLYVQVLDSSEVESEGAEDVLFDEDEGTTITFRALQSGKLLTLSHTFRLESKAETDQFLAIEAGDPLPGELASAKKMSKPERLYNLGQKMLTDRTGYVDGSDTPPWHLATTVYSYMLRELARMGKSLLP